MYDRSILESRLSHFFGVPLRSTVRRIRSGGFNPLLAYWVCEYNSSTESLPEHRMTSTNPGIWARIKAFDLMTCHELNPPQHFGRYRA